MIGLSICGVTTFQTEPQPTEIDNVKMSGAIFDILKLDNSVGDAPSFDISDEWTENSKILAQYKGNLYAGNVNLDVKHTSNIIIKRRKYGEFSWFNMFELPVKDASSFNFNLVDRYPSALIDYQYAVVPIINGLEGEYNFGRDDETDEEYIHCEFDGVVIMDRDIEYSSYYETTTDFTKNHTKTPVVTLNSKLPYIVSNSVNNYYTGTIGGVWMLIENCQKLLKLDSMLYREEFLDFLVNENFKILKLYDGRTYMVQITDTPTDSNSEHPDKHTISFDFTECGDPLSNEDMYLNGFLDISEAWWS